MKKFNVVLLPLLFLAAAVSAYTLGSIVTRGPEAVAQEFVKPLAEEKFAERW